MSAGKSPRTLAIDRTLKRSGGMRRSGSLLGGSKGAFGKPVGKLRGGKVVARNIAHYRAISGKDRVCNGSEIQH